MEGQYSLERGLVQTSATTMIVGSVLFLIAAFLPISFHVFPEPSPTKKLESISSDPGQWLASQVLFSLGAVVTVIGITPSRCSRGRRFSGRTPDDPQSLDANSAMTDLVRQRPCCCSRPASGP